MGWKSTIDITRKEAIAAIVSAVDKTPYDDLTNSQLEELMDKLDIGDDTNLPYYGYNFNIADSHDDSDDSE